ncbi:hypothetical protein [Sphingomonas abietis]|uniref:Uncharacterized protein n=1 Tax=Sphingomonas abietis TaxID=3012344 RepID=A0ABY7NN97_9SPHN|nr:hypothetical protein [Sphingomonas abietis]WBO20976.1 hypothetical protein PBT88_12245 [Sphingomonas abietis]
MFYRIVNALAARFDFDGGPRMQRDEQLRADARAYYNGQQLFADVPPFSEAERLRTPSYLAAVEVAQQDRLAIEEIELRRCQLSLI